MGALISDFGKIVCQTRLSRRRHATERRLPEFEKRFYDDGHALFVDDPEKLLEEFLQSLPKRFTQTQNLGVVHGSFCPACAKASRK
jgi:hypothetical protein